MISQNIHKELQIWALKENINHSSINSLLQILRKHECFKSFKNCTDARTLLGTPRETKLREVIPGMYYHFGLKNGIIKFLEEHQNFVSSMTQIDIVFSTDGLPISKSSSSQFWPILGSILSYNQIFLIGLYHSLKGRPHNPKMFLSEFIDEAKTIIEEGISFKGKNFTCLIKAFIADTPAKADILKIKHHAGYSSCTKCVATGEYLENRICFPDMDTLRTDEDFILNNDLEYHQGVSPLIDIPQFGAVSNVPIDYMHLVCLGVVKKLVYLWFHGTPTVRIRSHSEKIISNRLKDVRQEIPSEFQRKPRQLNEFKFWKAVEFRTFLLYTGPVVLKNMVTDLVYDNFMTLHVAISLLCTRNLDQHNITYADKLLNHFICAFKVIYGVHNVTHNVHGLLHLAKDCEFFGALDNFSAFQYENYMQQILKLLRKNDKPLQQVIKRIEELQNHIVYNKQNSAINKSIKYFMPHEDGPLPLGCTSPQYKKFKINNLFTIVVKNRRNWCCLLKNGEIVIVHNIVKCKNIICIVGYQFIVKCNFYTKPCESSFVGNGIFEVSELSEELEMWDVANVCAKMALFHINEGKFSAISLLHSDISETQNLYE